jgi:hypothetical protein
MRRIKEVLRLKYELGLGQRQIARSCSIGQATVNDYLRRAEAAGLRWPLTEAWDDDRIDRELFGTHCQVGQKFADQLKVADYHSAAFGPQNGPLISQPNPAIPVKPTRFCLNLTMPSSRITAR